MPATALTQAPTGSRVARAALLGRTRRRHVEGPVQAAIVAYLRTMLPHGWIVQGISNNPRSRLVGSQEKARGMIAGMPDLVVYGQINDRPWTGFIEVKAAGGRLSPEQIAAHDRLADLGFRVAVCRSIDEAREAGRRWGLPLRDVDLSSPSLDTRTGRVGRATA